MQLRAIAGCVLRSEFSWRLICSSLSLPESGPRSVTGGPGQCGTASALPFAPEQNTLTPYAKSRSSGKRSPGSFSDPPHLGAVRGKKVITTNPDTSQPCPDDKVNRRFKAASSIWLGQTSCGFQTSPMCRPGRAAFTWPLAMVTRTSGVSMARSSTFSQGGS